jgi:peptide/nickel transport system substrate-binding protein
MRTETRIGALIFACSGLLAACSGPSPRDLDVLRIAVEAAPGSVDPRRSVDATASRISGLVHAGLVRPGADGRPEPWLAESWQAAGPLAWRFRLRPGLRFHDGTPLSAADVAATFRAVLDPETASPKRAALGALESVEVLDDRTVEFRLATVDTSFFETAGLGILPAGLAARAYDPDVALPGAGPYRIETIGEAFETVGLVAAATYFEGAPAIRRIEFRVVPDAVMRVLELRHGSIDLVQNAIDPDNVAWLAANEAGLEILRTPYDAYQYLGMNHEHPVLGRRIVRRAIAHAIDREAIVRNLLCDQARVATGLLPPHHWAHESKVPTYAYDPEKARRLLARAGWGPDAEGNPRLHLVYKTTNQEVRRRIAEALADQLARVGIAVDVRSYEWGTFYGDVRAGAFHLYALSWVGIADPDIYRTVFHSAEIPPRGNNRGRYRDPVMDRLTERARGAAAGRRKTLVARIERRAARRLPYVPLWWPEQVIVASRRLLDFQPSPSGDLLPLASARLSATTRSATVRAPTAPALATSRSASSLASAGFSTAARSSAVSSSSPRMTDSTRPTPMLLGASDRKSERRSSPP